MSSVNDSAAPCDFLSWDTRFFGVRIARVRADILTPTSIDSVERWCAQNQIDCLYFPARADDAATIRLAESRGFRLVDVRVTLEYGSNISSNATASHTDPVRNARPSDIPTLRQIARVSHTDTRFFFDDRFPLDRCATLYETWIDSSCQGFAQAVFVADVNGNPAGYVTCQLSDDSSEGSIGLIAVDSHHQGKGIGRQLIQAALSWFATQRVEIISVVTQGRNVAAQRLYARCGFIPRKLELYYHRWFSGDDADNHGLLSSGDPAAEE